MGKEEKKADLMEVVNEIANVLTKHKVSAREVLMITRMLDTDAMLVLMLSQFTGASEEETED